MQGREVDHDWIRTMMASFGRRMTVEAIMEIYRLSLRNAEKEVNKALDIKTDAERLHELIIDPAVISEVADVLIEEVL